MSYPLDFLGDHFNAVAVLGDDALRYLALDFVT